MKIRAMSPGEMELIGALDRSEHITQQYIADGSRLRLIDVDIQAHAWGQPGGDSLDRIQASWRQHVDQGAVLLGAFQDGQLHGAALLDPPGAPLPDGVANLAALYVSRTQRGRGVGRALVAAVLERARALAAREIYVSATPTRSTVDFYLSRGFVVLAEPNPVMLAREPEDIHLLRTLER